MAKPTKALTEQGQGTSEEGGVEMYFHKRENQVTSSKMVTVKDPSARHTTHLGSSGWTASPTCRPLGLSSRFESHIYTKRQIPHNTEQIHYPVLKVVLLFFFFDLISFKLND